MPARRHVRLFAVLIACAFWVWHGSAQSAELTVESYEPAKYPVLAAAARMSGEATVRLKVDSTGKAHLVDADSTIGMFAQAAGKSAETWVFHTPENWDADRIVEVHFVFEIDESITPQPYGPMGAEFEILPSLEAIVRTGAVPRLAASDCVEVASQPPLVALTPSDYVLLARTACYGTCPGYEVKVFADGTVHWEGRAFVDHLGEHSYEIPEQAGRALIERFRTAEVWSLCADYSRSVTDSPSTHFEVSIAGAVKVIDDYADSSPSWFQRLRDAVDKEADTHQLRHGAPSDEPLALIDHEYLPKPGKTDLLDAIVNQDLEQVRELLSKGADANESDSSGWSALMYAAGGWSDWGIAELLLEAGANPKYSSPKGDTPLMVTALDGMFDEDLAQLSGAINAQNRDGVSALMLIASHGDPEEIGNVLAAGANPALRDARGRSALDYLEEANCHHNPIRGSVSMWAVESPDCDALDKDDYEKSKRLLARAMRRW